MILLVAGGRNYDDRQAVYAALDSLHSQTPIIRLVHGGCTGADALAASWAFHNRIDCKAFPAFWSKHGRAAGPIRNLQMIREAHPTQALLFPGHHGTADMARQLQKHGIPITYYREPETVFLFS